jgi:Tol biopolymer transport system component
MCVGALGGTPQRLLENVVAPQFTADGKSLYFVRVAENSPWLFRSSPPGSEPRKVGSAALPLNLSQISPVSPDGQHIVALTRTEPLLVSLPDGLRRTLPTGSEGVHIVSLGWFPDSRHIVAAEESTELIGSRLVAEDTQSSARRLILHTADPLTDVSISADGKRLAYSGGLIERDLLEYTVDGRIVRTVADSSLLEGFPSWAPASDRFVYRIGGPGQIDSLWMGNEGNAAATFVQRFSSNRALPSRISPDGGRIASADSSGILIASTSGGRPLQAYSSSQVESICWSPDGEWIWFTEGAPNLRKLRSQGGEPQSMKATAGVLADCSPDGRWLLRQVQSGIVLTSTDGKDERMIASIKDYPGVSKAALQFGEGGKVVYVLGSNRRSIDVLDVASGRKLRTITFDIPPENSIQTFSVNSADSRVLLDSGGNRNDVWVAEDFPQPETSWLRWFRHWN